MSCNNNNQSAVELGKVHVETHNAKLFKSWKATRPARCCSCWFSPSVERQWNGKTQKEGESEHFGQGL